MLRENTPSERTSGFLSREYQHRHVGYTDQMDVHDDDGDDKDGDDAASDSDLTVTNPNDPPSTVVVKLTNSEEAEKCVKCPRNVLNGFRCGYIET